MSPRPAGGFPIEREPWHDPALVLGSTGPQRVSVEDDADPDHEPPRIRGFNVADVAREQIQRVADLGGLSFEQVAEAAQELCEAFAPAPRVWQDEGDQA